MNDPKTPRLKAVALGMNDKTLTTLEMVLRGPGKGWCQLTDASDAQVAIVDGDSVGALTLLDQQRRDHPQRPIVAVSVRDIQLKGVISVRKPVQVASLLDALQTASQRLGTVGDVAATAGSEPDAKPAPATGKASPPEAAGGATLPRAGDGDDAGATSAPRAPDPAPTLKAVPRDPSPQRPLPRPRTRDATRMMETEASRELCGHQPDVDLRDPKASRVIFYDAQRLLQGLLERAVSAARADGKPLAVRGFARPIVLLPQSREYHTELTETQLRGLCHLPSIGRPDWIGLNEAELQLIDSQRAPLDALLWKVALWTARGRLPSGTDPWAPVSLRAWPNLTRLPLTPHALRIAALWSQGAHSPADTARQLAIAQRYVFAFYSGCHALGLLDAATPATDQAAPRKPARGLLGRLLAVLRGAA